MPSLAEIAYEAFAQYMSFNSVDEHAPVYWARVRPDIRRGWELAAEAVEAAVREQMAAAQSVAEETMRSE